MNFVREFEFIGPFAAIAGPIALLGLAFAYAVLSLRDSRNEVHDPEIGLKAGLYFMYSLSLLLILSGLTILVVGFLMESSVPSRPIDDFPTAQRTSFAMIVSGLTIGLFHLVVILGFTNNHRFPATRRVFVGWRLMVHSLVVLTSFTMLVVQVFQQNVSWDELKPSVGTLLVWVPSWLVHLVLMRFYDSAPVTHRRRSVMDD